MTSSSSHSRVKLVACARALIMWVSPAPSSTASPDIIAASCVWKHPPWMSCRTWPPGLPRERQTGLSPASRTPYTHLAATAGTASPRGASAAQGRRPRSVHRSARAACTHLVANGRYQGVFLACLSCDGGFWFEWVFGRLGGRDLFGPRAELLGCRYGVAGDGTVHGVHEAVAVEIGLRAREAFKHFSHVAVERAVQLQQLRRLLLRPSKCVVILIQGAFSDLQPARIVNRLPSSQPCGLHARTAVRTAGARARSRAPEPRGDSWENGCKSGGAGGWGRGGGGVGGQCARLRLSPWVHVTLRTHRRHLSLVVLIQLREIIARELLCVLQAASLVVRLAPAGADRHSSSPWGYRPCDKSYYATEPLCANKTRMYESDAGRTCTWWHAWQPSGAQCAAPPPPQRENAQSQAPPPRAPDNATTARQ